LLGTFVLRWYFHVTIAISFKIFPHSLSLTRIWWFILLCKLSILEKLHTHKQLQKWYREVPCVLNQLPPRVTPYKVNSLHRTLSKPGRHNGPRWSARLQILFEFHQFCMHSFSGMSAYGSVIFYHMYGSVQPHHNQVRELFYQHKETPSGAPDRFSNLC